MRRVVLSTFLGSLAILLLILQPLNAKEGGYGGGSFSGQNWRKYPPGTSGSVPSPSDSWRRPRPAVPYTKKLTAKGCFQNCFRSGLRGDFCQVSCGYLGSP